MGEKGSLDEFGLVWFEGRDEGIAQRNVCSVEIS